MTDHEQAWVQRLRIRTVGQDEQQADQYHQSYETAPYCVLERLADSGFFTQEDSVLDYGCMLSTPPITVPLDILYSNISLNLSYGQDNSSLYLPASNRTGNFYFVNLRVSFPTTLPLRTAVLLCPATPLPNDPDRLRKPPHTCPPITPFSKRSPRLSKIFSFFQQSPLTFFNNVL